MDGKNCSANQSDFLELNDEPIAEKLVPCVCEACDKNECILLNGSVSIRSGYFIEDQIDGKEVKRDKATLKFKGKEYTIEE